MRQDQKLAPDDYDGLGVCDGIMNGLMIELVAAVIIYFIVSWWLWPAAASPTCMTETEARKIWPTQHLYWHTMDHCWDAQPGRMASTPTHHPHKIKVQAPAPLKPMPAPPPRAELRPSLVVTNDKPIDSSLFTPVLFTGWPVLLDVDELTADKDPPECCWPKLEASDEFETRWAVVPIEWRR